MYLPIPKYPVTISQRNKDETRIVPSNQVQDQRNCLQAYWSTFSSGLQLLQDITQFTIQKMNQQKKSQKYRKYKQTDGWCIPFSPGFRRPPGSLQNVLPICKRSMWGWLCSCTCKVDQPKVSIKILGLEVYNKSQIIVGSNNSRLDTNHLLNLCTNRDTCSCG